MEPLSTFAFIIGKWDCDVHIKTSDSKIEHRKAVWRGRYILNNNAIEDQYEETDEQGNLMRLGINIRAYNNEVGWIMKWFDAINSTWLDLGPKELGGVTEAESEISFKHYAPDDIIVRVTFFNIQKNSFSWKADITNDQGKTWKERVFTITATRIE